MAHHRAHRLRLTVNAYHNSAQPGTPTVTGSTACPNTQITPKPKINNASRPHHDHDQHHHPDDQTLSSSNISPAPTVENGTRLFQD
jgi:hypothetical protein